MTHASVAPEENSASLYHPSYGVDPQKNPALELEAYLGVHDEIALTVWDAHKDDDDGFTYESEILALDRSTNRMMIGLPSTAKEQEKPLVQLFEADLVVGMVVNKGPVQVLCYPIIQQLARGENSQLTGVWCHLPKPHAYELHNRRRHVRVGMTLPVMIDWYKDGLPKQIGAYSLDISGQGLAFNAKRGFEPGQHLQLTFQFRRNVEKVCLDFLVVSSCKRPHPTQKDYPYFTGGCFLNLTENQEKMLVAECFRKQIRVAA